MILISVMLMMTTTTTMISVVVDSEEIGAWLPPSLPLQQLPEGCGLTTTGELLVNKPKSPRHAMPSERPEKRRRVPKRSKRRTNDWLTLEHAEKKFAARREEEAANEARLRERKEKEALEKKKASS
jgi:hypothetical protein